MSLFTVIASSFVLFTLLSFLYIRLNDRRLSRLPPEALQFSPTRITPEGVRELAEKLSRVPPISIHEQLPPKTGRRYIIIGGGGFLGGWVVSSLIERGEDPKSIRLVDIRRPAREDLLTGKGNDTTFIQTDISDESSVNAAFSAPWLDGRDAEKPEITIFHTAANIRFYERSEALLPPSERVNVHGTQNVVNAARAIGANVLIYTSSGSVGVWQSRFFLWPWETEPKRFVQVINDSEERLPKKHADFFSNYAATKIRADKIVRQADKSKSGFGVLRTGCIRPGNGMFGPRGDMLCGSYLVRKTNPTWVANIVQSFCYVENCALAHLCYEQRLIELLSGGKNPDIGGQAFNVADPGPIQTYGDVYTFLETLSDGECHFPNLPPTLMLIVATLIEAYYCFRHYLISIGSSLGKRLPAINGDLINLQPPLFALTSVHLIFDDSRARLSPEKGGLGYTGAWTTYEGLYKTWVEHESGVGQSGRRSDLAGVGLGWGVAKANEKVVKKIGVDPVKVRLSSR